MLFFLDSGIVEFDIIKKQKVVKDEKVQRAGIKTLVCK